jgi:high-affinity Fe2+/Pb2+ permease
MSESSQNSTVPPPATSSETAVSLTMKHGLEKVIVQTAAGLVLGGLAGIVLARGGGASGARKGLAGLGAGLGLGSAWTRTSMDLEDMFANSSSKK